MSNEGELQDIQDCFSFFDNKGDGKINVEQVGTCLRSIGLCPTEAQVAQLVSQFKEGDRLSVEQFIPIYHELKKDSTAQDRTYEQLVSFFANYDREDNGQIESAVLEYLLTGLGEALTPKECQLLLTGRETADGTVMIADLARLLTSSSPSSTS